MELRKYNIADSDMFQQSRTVHAQFLLDKAAFVAKNPALADPFAANWMASIEASEVYETDENRQDRQMAETDDVNAVMATGRELVNEARFYIEEAIANENTRNSFGLNEYGEASANQGKLLLVLKTINAQANVPANNALLLAKGYTQVAIDNLLTVANALATENTEQDLMAKGRPSATKARIIQYNSTHDFWHKVNRTSKVVYYGNVEKLNEYKKSEGAESDTNLRGEVKDGSNGNQPLKSVFVKVVELDLVDKTNSNGRFHHVSIPAGSYTLEYTLPGYTTVTQQVVVTAAGIITAPPVTMTVAP